MGSGALVSGERARLVIVDDHALVRDGIKSLLCRRSDLEVVGEAANGREAVELCDRARPDLVLMDVHMPEVDGLAATEEIKQKCPHTKMLMLTIHDDPNHLYEALKAGASGFILKHATGDELIAAVRQVLEGGSPLNLGLATRLLLRLVGTHTHTQSPPEARERKEPPFEPLTRRQEGVLRLLATGLSNGDIARKLVITEGTVKNHVHRIISKLRVSNRAQAAFRAIELGILPSEPEE